MVVVAAMMVMMMVMMMMMMMLMVMMTWRRRRIMVIVVVRVMMIRDRALHEKACESSKTGTRHTPSGILRRVTIVRSAIVLYKGHKHPRNQKCDTFHTFER
eukprot:89883-Karenia_brevis.AAC.1